MSFDIRARIIAIKNALEILSMTNKLTTLYDDLPPVPFLTARIGASIPTLTTFNGSTKQYTFAINNEVFGTGEVTHKYINGGNLMPHIHWATNGVDTTDRYVKWEMEYSYANMSSAFSTPTIITVEAKIPANTPSLTHYMTDLPQIVGTNITVGDYICWRVRRITSSGTAPTSNPFGLALGVHVHESVLK